MPTDAAFDSRIATRISSSGGSSADREAPAEARDQALLDAGDLLRIGVAGDDDLLVRLDQRVEQVEEFSYTEEFFYLFNTLIESPQAVVITCDTYPKENLGHRGAPDPLRLGFDRRPRAAGARDARCDPAVEGRVGGDALDEQVAFFIAKHIRTNVRELEGALKRILAYANFHGQEITLPMAKDALRDLLAVQNRQISVDNIQKTVADSTRSG